MGRLLFVVLGLFAFGIMTARAPADRPSVRQAVAETPVSGPAPAYRPGEPMLVPGQATELVRAGDGHFYADVTVGGQPITMLVDTGASTVALTMADAQRLGIAVDPAAMTVVGTGASGPVRGVRTVLTDVTLGPLRAGPVEAVVLEGLDRSLLGQSWLGRLQQVQIDGERMTLR